VVICLEYGADLHMAQLMPLPLTVSCFSKIQIGFPFWYWLTRVVPDKGPLNVCVCVCVLQMNDFATFDVLPFIPLYVLCTHFWHLVHCNELLPTPLLQTLHGHLAAFCHTI